jgi:hypothetical protein
MWVSVCLPGEATIGYEGEGPKRDRTHPGREPFVVTAPNNNTFPARLPSQDEEVEEAPSFIWLLVMPAIPLLGGGLICLSRRWRHLPSPCESRSLTSELSSEADPTNSSPLTELDQDRH